MEASQQVTQESSERASQIPSCPALEVLWLWRAKIGAEGCKELASSLPKCPALKVLYLGENPVGDEGVKRACSRRAEDDAAVR